MDREKYVDEGWKDSVEKQKDPNAAPLTDQGHVHEHEHEHEEVPEVNFLNYVTSLAIQALIFMGQMPHPVTNQMEKNLLQAKFLIDTLGMIKEKTTGNLSKEEAEVLETSLYELQLKFVELIKQEKKV